MTNTKTLMLATFAALSLSAGAAMARQTAVPAPSSAATSTNSTVIQTNQVRSQLMPSESTDQRNEDYGMRAYDAYNPYLGN
jgi:hypothetical protein